MGARLYQAMLFMLAPLAFFGVLLHLAWALPFAALIFPWMAQPARNRVMRFWARVLMLMIGARFEARGEPVAPRLAATGMVPGGSGQLIVANHTSWLDIYAINALVPTRFIAKAEIARWPVIGWLVALVGTLFIERGRRHAVHNMNRIIGERLRAGETIGVFAEGTTTDGTRLLPFHANMLQPALDHGSEVRPVAIQFKQHGRVSPAAAYTGATTLFGSLWRILIAPHLVVEVHWLPAIPMTLSNRHAVARAARAAIADALGLRDDAETEVSGAAPHALAALPDNEPATTHDPATASR